MMVQTSLPVPKINRARSGFGVGLVELGLCLIGQCLESVHVMNGNVREDLAINGNAGLVEAVDKASIGEAAIACCRVDALDPEGAEIAFLYLAVAVSILTGLLDGLIGCAEGVLATAVIAFGGLDNFAVTGVGCDASFNT